jgi:quinol-cytochrome oxidoreductase complex cytochrome b subunit
MRLSEWMAALPTKIPGIKQLSVRTAPGRSVDLTIGSIVLLLCGLLLASGALLLLHYHPSPAYAHDSVARIAGQLPYGDLVRGIHGFSGDLLAALLLLQLFVMVLRRTFTAPRQFVYLTGVAMLSVVLALLFTGDVLPWSRQAYLQARVGSQIAAYVPVVGGGLRRLLRGGDEVSYVTLHRVFAFHAALFPACLTLVLGLYLYGLWASPVHPRVAARGGDAIPVYPELFVRLSAGAVAALSVVMTLATFVARPVGEAADPMGAFAAAEKPRWYALAVHDLFRIAPPKLLGLDSPVFIGAAGSLLFLVVLALPFLDRVGSWITAALACLALACAVLLTIHGLV